MTYKIKTLNLIILIFLFLLSPVFAKGYEITGNYINTNGDIVGFNYYSGSLLLVDATATWCTSCDAQLENLDVVYDHAENIKILTLSIDTSDTIPKVIDLKAKFSSPWDFGLDHNAEFTSQYTVSYLPTLYLFGESGAVLKKWTGITSYTDILEELSLHDEDLEVTDIGENGNSAINPGSLVENLFQNPVFKALTISLVVFYLYGKSMGSSEEKEESVKKKTRKIND